MNSEVSTLLDHSVNAPRMDASMKDVISNLSNIIDNHSRGLLSEQDDSALEFDLEDLNEMDEG